MSCAGNMLERSVPSLKKQKSPRVSLSLQAFCTHKNGSKPGQVPFGQQEVGTNSGIVLSLGPTLRHHQARVANPYRSYYRRSFLHWQSLEGPSKKRQVLLFLERVYHALQGCDLPGCLAAANRHKSQHKPQAGRQTFLHEDQNRTWLARWKDPINSSSAKQKLRSFFLGARSVDYSTSFFLRGISF